MSGWIKTRAIGLFGVGMNVNHRFQTGAAPREARATPVFLCRDAIRRGVDGAADLQSLGVFTGSSEVGAVEALAAPAKTLVRWLKDGSGY